MMGILGNIFGKIFHSSQAATQNPQATQTGQGTPNVQAAPQQAPQSTQPSAAQPQTGAQPSASAQPIQIDVTAVLDDLARNNPQKLNWRTSIVDLMKLLGIDSSLNARKELAEELHYTGDTNDSAAMNVWLHKQVMVKIAANGGKVPDELRH